VLTEAQQRQNVNDAPDRIGPPYGLVDMDTSLHCKVHIPAFRSVLRGTMQPTTSMHLQSNATTSFAVDLASITAGNVSAHRLLHRTIVISKPYMPARCR
jgi:hypothetical protein